jgi:hypothetical protein
MTTVLGLFGLLFFIACVIAAAAGITWLVVRLTPSRSRPASSGTDSG